MEKLTIQEIKTMLKEEEINEVILNRLSQDQRKGVQHLVHALSKKQILEQEKQEKFKQMSVFEENYRKKGFKHIAGIDEAGRGPLAGPVVAASVILPENFLLPGLNDSKLLTKSVRENFFEEIQKKSIDYQISIVNVSEIDRINIFEATKQAMRETVRGLSIQPDMVLIDAVKLTGIGVSYEAIEKGDSKSITIAAASILAKVTRDRIMEALHNSYPQYYFNEHKGYGTKKHLEAISKHGICPEHRKSFAPIKNQMV